MIVVKNPPASAGDIRGACSIPGSGRSPAGGHSNPPQYSCLEKPMDRGAWQVTVHGVAKGLTRLKWLSTHTHTHTHTHICKCIVYDVSEVRQFVKPSLSIYKNGFSFISPSKLTLDQESPFLWGWRNGKLAITGHNHFWPELWAFGGSVS